MKCPICQVDLSALDLVSRTEHVDLCIENGPSVVELDDFGRPTVKRNLPPGKQRKICPICDKTFTNLFSHFKTCAIKHDVPPHMMLEHWETINKDSKNPKQFPCDLLDTFVAKCLKENRVGDQVDIARALSLSMGKKDPLEECSRQHTTTTTDGSQVSAEELSSGTSTSHHMASKDAAEILMQNANQQPAASNQPQTKGSKKAKVIPKTRLQLTDSHTKRSNVLLRVERELSVTRSLRYRETLRLAQINPAHKTEEDGEEEEECMIVPHFSLPPTQVVDEKVKSSQCDTLFFRSRMKNCDSSEACFAASCKNHELNLLLEEFQHYSGTSMDPLVKEVKDDIEEVFVVGSSNSEQQQQQQQPSTSSQTAD